MSTQSTMTTTGTIYRWFFPLALFMTLIIMSYIVVSVGIGTGMLVAMIPLVVLMLIAIFKDPFNGFLLIFLLNYFVIAIIRYTDVSGLSVLIDILILVTFVSIILNRVLVGEREQTTKGFSLYNGLLAVAVLWLLYCMLEIVNPSSMIKAWFLARITSAYFLLIVVLAFLLFKNFRRVEILLNILSVLTLLGLAKALMQKWVGFDAAEMAYLNAGSYKTHLLVSGTRYFSFFASAGILGAVMGHAMVLFGIAAIYVKKRSLKIYYVVVALAALYGLMISGTRGALAVPLAGFFLFALLSKQARVMIPTLFGLLAVYVFFSMTTIGQSNALIRRMRTAFNPNDPSLMVRVNNQKLLAEHLKNKPFGEGLGLSGVESQDLSMRYTTSIPTDSWYVKIWVETGIIGLCLHLGILLYVIVWGSYLVLFRIRDRLIKGILAALLCSMFGILVSSYGNLVLGQFPVLIIVYTSMAIIFMGPYFDRQRSQQNMGGRVN